MTSIVKLKGLFRQVASSKQAIFNYPINLNIQENEHWAITGPRKVDFLQILSGKHVADHPIEGRTYPFLHKDVWPSQVIQYIEFGNVPVKASHLSARYEHFRDEFDSSMLEMLQRVTNDSARIQRIIDQCELNGLENRWAVGLSNGQTRRFRLARALLKNPKLLLVDEPFLGLDPHSRQNISNVLSSLKPEPHVIVGLRYQDEFPPWITNVAVVSDKQMLEGTAEEMRPEIARLREERVQIQVNGHERRAVRSEKSTEDFKPQVIHLDDITISYRGEDVIKNLTWEVKQGERWHLQGENGAGKSTLLSILTADHPQSWNSKVSLFQEPRQTGKHSYFGINEKIGHASPEIHAIFPGKLTVFQSVITGYVPGSLIPPTKLSDEQKNHAKSLINELELDENALFRDITLSDQKCVLFLRAIVKNPKILILDEAFSAMSEERIASCKILLDKLPDTTVISVSHITEEIPASDKYLRLFKGGFETGDIK